MNVKQDKLPDFMIIGAMKSATSTLQEQLYEIPGIFMCTPKEPYYYSNDEVYKKGKRWYLNLFKDAGENDLIGEASTHYTKLPTYPETIKRIRADYPSHSPRFIYVMRHPVDRLLSHFMHEYSMGFYSEDLELEIDKNKELFTYGDYSYQLKPFFDEFGKENVLPVFFDRLLKEKTAELQRVCRFIGLEKTVTWNEELKASNVSKERFKRFPGYHFVINSWFSKWVRRNFVPQSFRDVLKNKITVDINPQLSEAREQQLIDHFDQDLSRLGKLLGVELNCSNFKQVTAEQELNWV